LTTKKDVVPYVLPFGIARYPKISQPDTNGKFADNKFKTDIAYDDATMDKIEADLRAIASDMWPDAEPASLYLPIKEVYKDKEKKQPDGRVVTLKSKYRPAVFDAKKRKLPEGVKIGGGSEIRVASACIPFERKITALVNGKTSQITQYGITLRLGDTQVRKLVEYAGGGDGSAFDEVEGGFEYDGTDSFGDEVVESVGSATDF
jgi:hypothetical protein